VKADRLEQEFAPRRAPSGGDIPAFEPADALALVDRAAEEGVPIVRVDGRPAGGGADAPREQLVADFSAAVAQGHGCWADAEAFIKERGKLGLVFGFVLGDDPIEAV
jgi:hypothetical protein